MTVTDAIPASQGTDMRSCNIPAAVTALILALFFLPPMTPHYQGLCPVVFAEDLWKQELMDICSKTDEAMTFSRDELKRLLQRGEKLKPRIEALEETPRKVYLKRLQMCMNLYSFMLDSRGADKK